MHITVLEPSLGRLLANPSSVPANLQGCDQSLWHLNAAGDAPQAKL